MDNLVPTKNSYRGPGVIKLPILGGSNTGNFLGEFPCTSAFFGLVFIVTPVYTPGK